MSAETLERLLVGPGTPKDLGSKIWGLINGVDDSEVAKAKDVPQQISIVRPQLPLKWLALTSNTGRQLHQARCHGGSKERVDYAYVQLDQEDTT